MKDIIKKSALIGLVGVPIFIVSSAISTRIMKDILQSIKKQNKIKK